MKVEVQRCNHYHTPKEHPHCFVNKDFHSREGKPLWYQQSRIAYLDIEATNLAADFGIVISWCLKMENGKVYFDALSPQDLADGTFDANILKSLLEIWKRVDVLITFFGKGFDMPFLRSRALKLGLPFPEYGTFVHIDMFFHAKRLLRLHRRSLEVAAAHFGLEGKTRLDGDTWLKATLKRDQKAINYIVTHNKADVVLLEALHHKLEPYMKPTRTSI